MLDVFAFESNIAKTWGRKYLVSSQFLGHFSQSVFACLKIHWILQHIMARCFWYSHGGSSQSSFSLKKRVHMGAKRWHKSHYFNLLPTIIPIKISSPSLRDGFTVFYTPLWKKRCSHVKWQVLPNCTQMGVWHCRAERCPCQWCCETGRLQVTDLSGKNSLQPRKKHSSGIVSQVLTTSPREKNTWIR